MITKRFLCVSLLLLCGHIPSSVSLVLPTRPFATTIPQTTTTSSTTQLQLTPSSTLAWSVVGHVTGGALGTPFVVQSTKPGGWYRKISLPSWTPPDRVFAPVWTTLYTCMGIAVARILNLQQTAKKSSLILWACHFALNILWAPIFFGLQRLRLGLVVNGLLVGTLLSVMKLFFEMDPVSAYLLVPYLGWLLFATYLNYAVCKRNPTNQGYNNAMLEADIIKLQKQAAKYADGL